jgi:DNA modification methylase
LKSAQLLGRNWIDIDKSKQTIKVSIEKLNSISSNIFVEKQTYKIINSHQEKITTFI